MRAAAIVVCFIVIICVAWPSGMVPAQEAKPERDRNRPGDICRG
jgi:hypothetical protein